MSDLPRLDVDFNDIDDDGRLQALVPPSMEKPARRTRLHLVDDDGNTCEGVVRLCEPNGLVSLRVDWDTWVPAEESPAPDVCSKCGTTGCVEDANSGWYD